MQLNPHATLLADHAALVEFAATTLDTTDLDYDTTVAHAHGRATGLAEAAWIIQPELQDTTAIDRHVTALIPHLTEAYAKAEYRPEQLSDPEITAQLLHAAREARDAAKED
ncbi:hypothetical protein ACUY2L_06720 [Corynebacterium mastitidis]